MTPIFSAWRSEVRVRCSATRASAEKREKATSSFLKYSSSYSHKRSHAHAHAHTEYSRPKCSLMCVYLLSLLDLFLMNCAGRKQNNPATQLHPSAQSHKEIIMKSLFRYLKTDTVCFSCFPSHLYSHLVLERGSQSEETWVKGSGLRGKQAKAELRSCTQGCTHNNE